MILSPRKIQALSGWILGVLTWTLTGNLGAAVAGSIFGCLVVWLTGDPSWALTGGVLSICVVSVPIILWSIVFGDYRLWGWIIVAAVGGVWLALSIGLGQKTTDGLARRQSVWLSILGGTWIVLQTRHGWSPVELLRRVGSLGEDNGGFLNNVSLTYSGLDAVISSSSGDYGGSILGIFIVLGSTLLGVGKSGASGPLVVTETLLRLYDTLSYLFIGFCAILGLNRTKSQGIVLDGTLFLVAGFGATIFLSGLYRGGHLAALVFVVLASAILVICQQTRSEADHQKYLSSFPILIFALLSQAWWPSIIITAIGMGVFVVAKRVQIGQRLRAMFFGRTTLAFLLLVLTLASVLVARIGNTPGSLFIRDPTLTDSVLLSGSPRSLLQGFKDLMSLVGDDVRVAGWFAIVLILLSLLSVARRGWIADSFQVLIVALSVSSVTMMVAGWLVPPFEPQYGPNKMLYLASMILFPVAITEVSELAAKRSNLLSGTLAICVTTGLFVASATPLVELTNRIRPREPVGWATGVAASFTLWPDRLVTCLSTRVDGPPDDAWRCSRLLAGMQGMNYPTDSLKNQPHSKALNMIYGANMCAVSSEHVADISLSDFSRLTLVISDGNRLSTERECQAKGWASTEGLNDDRWLLGVHSGIRWDLVKIVSYDGTVVSPSFKYLDKSSNYAEADIERLESKLR